MPRSAALLLGAALLAAGPASGLAARPADSAPPDPSCTAIRAAVARTAPVAGERLRAREVLASFYEGRACRPAWNSPGARGSGARALLEALRRADLDGLAPEDYHVGTIAALLESAAPAPGADVELDLLLTDAFLLYAAHLTRGRVDPASLEPAWNIPARARDLGYLLRAALDHDTVAEALRLLPPDRADYRILRDALAACRAAAAAGGWPLVPWGPPLHPGDRGARVGALRRRLEATGDLPKAAAGADLFDAALADGLRGFQRRHGLEPDAVCGARTIAQLNASATVRARQVAANLERLRWLPRAPQARAVTVNIADFRLELLEEGAPPLGLRVIAGRQARRTPFFAGEITSILLNPSWTVPETIAIEDKLPLILEDRDWLAKEHVRVLGRAGKGWREVDPADVDWMTLGPGRFPYRLRQDPGPWNALGRVKFQIPNPWDIYLHDTPSRSLFDRAERIFSSGCIRVERPLELAARLLAGDRRWSPEALEAAVASGETVAVPLRRPMPVFLLYWTAWVDAGGTLQFRDDVYGRDAALIEALARPPAP
jgi:murein L,D-transpeptidase YcbB/YkuD